MKRIGYELKGKDVPVALQGATLFINSPEGLADAVALTVKGESDVVAKFGDGYTIALQGLLRTRSGKDGATVDGLQAFADGYKYTVQEAGNGAKREVKPQTKVARKSQDTGNKVLERAIADAEYAKKLIRLGGISQEDIDEYAAIKAEAAAAAQG